MYRQPKTGDEADTVIVRPSATTLFAISSTDRYSSYLQRRTNPTSPFSFPIQKNQSLMNGYFRRIAMSEFRMNWTLPNIAAAWGNNIMNFNYQNTTASPIVAATLGNTNVVTYVVTSSAAFKVGNLVTIAGVTGAATYNGNATIISIPTNNNISVQYVLAVSGSPSFSGATISITSTPTQTSTDQSGLYVTFTVSNSLSYQPGNTITISGITGGAGWNGTARVVSVNSNSNNVIFCQYTTGPVSGVPNLSAASIVISQIPLSATTASTKVTYQVTNADNYATGQLVTIAGLVGGTGYNGTATILQITDTTHIVLQYATPVSGTVTGFTSSTFIINAVFQIIIPDGFYGAEELATALQYAIQTGGYAPGSSTFIPGIINFTVSVSTQTEDDQMIFISPGYITFWFTPIGNQTKELFDMLTLPVVTSPGISQMWSGIPDLRATEYIDLVCAQLTNNMNQKDSSSAPVVRDMLARIYTDDDVPSQSVVTTNIYNNTIPNAALSSVALNGLLANFTLTTATSSNFSINELAYVTGVTGGTGWNGEVIVRNIPTASNVTVTYTSPDNPDGTPTLTNAFLKGSIGAQTGTSTPVTTWDDRVNGVTPFVLYRQFPVLKQIQWEHTQPIGNLRFEMYDSQGRSMADLWAPYGNGTVISEVTTVTCNAPSLATFGLYNTSGFSLGNFVQITGVINAAGYNNSGSISAITSSNVQINYGPSVSLTGTPNGSNALVTSAFNYTGSFAWNCSLLCSED